MAAWAVCGAGLLTGCGGSSDKGVRIVLVTLDTLRFDALTAEMPLTLAWAEQNALRFERFYAATPITQPTHATLFTGLHPWQHGVSRNGQVLGDEFTTLAEVLQGAGFETFAVVAALPVTAPFGFGQGFDHFDARFEHGRKGRWAHLRYPAQPFYRLATAVTDAALAALDACERRRQFLWIHYYDPHAPYGNTVGSSRLSEVTLRERIERGADAAAEIANARELYGRDVGHVDRELGRVLERLQRDAGRFDTHVVVTADHGESFGEDASLGHGTRLTAGQIHVPLLIASPALESGVRSDVAGSADVAPTILSLAGIPSSDLQTEGRDLSRKPSEDGSVFGMRGTYRNPHEEWRIDGSLHVLEEFQFYTVDERGGLLRGSAETLELFRTFQRELQGHEAGPKIDAQLQAGLRALGYVQ